MKAQTRTASLDIESSRLIAEVEARFHTIFHSAPVGIVLADLQSDAFIEVNDAYCEIVGRSWEDLTNNGWQGVTHPEDREITLVNLDRLRRGLTDHYSLTKRYIRPDGDIVWAKISVTAIRTDELSDPEQYLVIVVDITDRKRIEDQLEHKNSELERFTYTVSHELKTPLVTINGILGLLQRDVETDNRERIQHDMKMISDAVETMGQQLESLLELSRLGHIGQNPITFPLSQLCITVVNDMHGVIDPCDAEFDIDSAMPSVFADPLRFREIVQNLVENAIKFTSPQHRPRIEISADQEGDMVTCRIRDNGPGIPFRYRQRVFELFDCLDPGVAGTGIGLALVKRNVELHGGQIWIETPKDGVGSTFCFTLPAASS